MKKIVKIALIFFGALVVLITAAALLVPRFVDPNQYKGRISTLVKEKTGRDLTITGDISLSVFPWLGAKIGAVELGNAPGFDTGAFAAVRQVQVKVKLLPLLSRQVEADVVTVEGLVLNLERSADGRTNWEDLSKTSTATQEVKPETAPSETPVLAALAVGGLDIQNARITWTDHQTGNNIILKNLAVKTSEVNLVDPVTAKIGVDLDTGDLGLTATVETETRIEFNLDSGRYAAKNLSFRADLGGQAVPGDAVTVTAGGDAAFDAAAGSFDLSGFKLNAVGLNMAPYMAEATIETNGAGDLAAGAVRLDDLMIAVTLTGNGDRLTAGLTANAKADLNARQVSVSDLALRVPELSIKGLKAAIEASGIGSAVADLAAGTFTLNTPPLSGTLSGEAIPGGSMPVALDIGLQGDMNRKTFKVAPLKLSAAGINTKITLDLVQKESGPQAKGTLTVDVFNPRNLLPQLGLELPETADPGALSTAALGADFSAGADTLSIKNLLVRLDDTRITGALGVANLKMPHATFDLSLDRLQLDRYLPPGEKAGTSKRISELTLKGELAADAGFKVFQVVQLALAGKMDEKIPFGFTAADTRLDLNGQTLSAGALTLSAEQLILKAKANVTGFSTNPAFTAEVQTDTFNLRRILSDLEMLPETADNKVLSAVALTAALSGSTQAVSVPSLKLRLDDTNITGKAGLTLTPASAYDFDIAVDSIDADRYLPPPSPETAQNTAPPATPGAAAGALPVELIQNLNLAGKLSIGNLKISNLRIANIKMQAAAKEGLLTLSPLNADLYGGAYSGKIQLDARGPTPKLTLDETLAGVQSGNLLKDLQGEALLTGLAGADIKLSAAGADTDTLLSSLGGTVSFTFNDGSIKGVDILGKICQTLMAVNVGSLKTQDLVESALQKLTQKASGTKTTAKEETDSTSFSELGGSMTFVKGVGTSEDLSIKSPLLRVSGAGTLDLTKQYLDYDATAALVKSCQGQGGESTEDLKNVPIPVTISGPFTNLKVKPNLTAGILEVLARKQKKQDSEASSATPESTSSSSQAQEEPETMEDAVKGILQDLLKKK